jgi:hypothetical protein
MANHLATLSVALCWGIAIAQSIPTPLQAQLKPVAQVVRESLPGSESISFRSPPNQGEPKQSESGGGRGQCLQHKSQIPLLTPLTPGTVQGLRKITGVEPELVAARVVEYPTLTIVEHPTFFIYVPPTSAQQAEFILTEQIDKNQSREVYYTTLTLPRTPGIVSVKLPEERSPLKIGKVYQWYFALKCDSQPGLMPDGDSSGNPYVLGWIQRTELDPSLVKVLDKAKPLERAALYGNNGIWHELLTTLVELQHSQPETTHLWKNLLTSDSVKLNAISETPLLECCTPEN